MKYEFTRIRTERKRIISATIKRTKKRHRGSFWRLMMIPIYFSNFSDSRDPTIESSRTKRNSPVNGMRSNRILWYSRTEAYAVSFNIPEITALRAAYWMLIESRRNESAFPSGNVWAVEVYIKDFGQGVWPSSVGIPGCREIAWAWVHNA